ncbi:hypothetical protein SCc_041 [Serratia symbiotica str. 'Cinara cedri']|nr:hypothetical protein SCc_041 [Serratia symbiotica str. 'Cinara cedri']
MIQEIIPFIKNYPVLCLTWAALLFAIITITFNNYFSNIKKISHNEAIRLINQKNGKIIDTRSRNDFSTGHITNAINLTVNEIKNSNLGGLAKHKTQPIIVVCANGTNSREPAAILNKAGFSYVVILEEGITGWNRDNLPLVRK